MNIAYPAFMRSSALALGCAAFYQIAQAVSPPPDGGYANFNTAEGTFSLLSLTTGSDNTALGARALQNNTSTSYNTAVGYGTLFSNQASLNTAVGFDALFSNTSGGYNTATGARALQRNTTGAYNTADGASALFSNGGSRNTAVGAAALFGNQSGYSNTAVGTAALLSNPTGSNNTAVGDGALINNNTSSIPPVVPDDNTAVGVGAIGGDNNGHNTAVGAGALGGGPIDSYNTAIGFQAGFTNDLFGGPGNYNIAVGAYAGTQTNVLSGNWNIDIGNVGSGLDSNTIRIGTQFDPTSGTGQNGVFVAGLAGTTLDNGVPVVVDTSTGQLGVLPSSQRFKTDIKPMNKTSEGILALRPVTFCYQNSSTGTAQFGLIAEEVAKVDPHLVVRDSDGQPYTVRYDAVNAMLLNEFLKEHKKVESQQATISELKSTVGRQQKGMDILTAQLKDQAAQIQKVSAQVEMSRPLPWVVLSNP
jgi:hypothetical protein